MRPVPSGACVGVGIDVVELSRFASFLQRNEQDLAEIFTPRERAAAAHNQALYLASRWALKEATLKALGTGWASHVQWTEVEALGRLAAPQISLRGRAQQLAEEVGGTWVAGSIAYAGDSVLALVVLRAAAAGTKPGRKGEGPCGSTSLIG